MTDFSKPHLIGGQWQAGRGDTRFQVLNPATGQTEGEIQGVSAGQLDEALASTQAAFNQWRFSSVAMRAELVAAVAEAIRTNADELARVICVEQGKTLAEAEREIGMSAAHHDWHAQNAGLVTPEDIIGPGGARGRIIYQPVGPVAAFTPWNHPLMMPARKMVGAITAGCSLVIKPSEETPGAAILLAKLYLDAGAPPGLINMVFGEPANISRQLIASPVIRKVSLTGSAAVGKQLMGLAAPGLKRATMELGGHAPVIVWNDVDVEALAAQLAVRKAAGTGQVCISPSRFFIHRDIYHRFVEQFAETFAGLKVGAGLDPATQLGPLSNARRLDSLDALVADAVQHGARMVTGGQRLNRPGFFFAPTVLADVPDSARIMNEEPFGPVVPISAFDELAEVMQRANATAYGLAAYVFTQRQEVADQLCNQLEAGMISLNGTPLGWPNAPFGGVKESGLGREGGREGLMEYLQSKFIAGLLPAQETGSIN